MKKIIIKKRLAMFIAVIMILTALPLEMLSVFALEETEVTAVESEAYEVSEIIEKRGEFEKHFKMSDGTIKAITYAEPIHYLDSNGVWQEVDNTLTLNTLGTRYLAGSGDFQAELGSTSKMSVGESLIEWSVKAVTESGKTEIGSITAPVSGDVSVAGMSAMSAGLSNTNTSVITSTDTLGEVKALGRLTVSHPDKSVIMSSSVVKGKITQNVTVLRNSDFNGYEVTYKLNGLTPVLGENNAIMLNDSEGNAEYTTSPLLIVDANGRVSDDYTVSLSTVNDIATVTYTIEDESLTAPFTLIAETTNISYSSGIIDTTTTSGESGDNSTLPWLYVGYENYDFSSFPGSTVKARYTTYIKFSELPNVKLENSLGIIRSAKLKFKPSTSGLTEADLKECSPAVFAANPFRVSSESISQCSYTSLGSLSYERHDIDSDLHVNMTFDENDYTCCFDVVKLITEFGVDSMFYAIDYTDVTDNGNINDASNTNQKTTFFSTECGNYANLGTTASDLPSFEIVYYDISECNCMILNARSNGKYLDINADGLPTITATNEYKRENLWSLEPVPNTENTYYIRTSESVYINKVYDDIIPDPTEEGEEKLMDTDVKYLALNSDNTSIIITPNTQNKAQWKVEMMSGGRVLIYQQITTENTVQNYYIYQSGQGTLVPAVSYTNAYWTLTRCDIISGKVYTIKTMAADEYISVDNGYDHSQTDLTMEATTYREAYNHQTFRIEYMPQYNAYKLRAMVCMNGWFRPISIIRSSGSLSTGYSTQIYNDFADNENEDEICQLFDIITVDNQINVNYIVSSTANNQYLAYYNNDVLVKEKDSVNEENQTWLIEEYTEYYEEYYKTFDIDFPVHYDTLTNWGKGYYYPWRVTSSRAWRDLKRINVSGASTDHAGVDFGFGQGVELYAPFDGIILLMNEQGKKDSELGYYIIIQSKDHMVIDNSGNLTPMIIVLQHMKEAAVTTNPNLVGSNVTDYIEVNKGDLVGLVGDTGVGYAHLHFGASYSHVGEYGVYPSKQQCFPEFTRSIDVLLFYDRVDFQYSPDT